mgnify:CR=1 FL=1
MARATVVHCRRSAYDVLIDRTTILGNPFRIGRHGTREDVIRKHKRYFYARLERDPAFKAAVLGLAGKVLGCWCKGPPEDLPCHGDTVAGYLNAYDWIEEMKVRGARRGPIVCSNPYSRAAVRSRR